MDITLEYSHTIIARDLMICQQRIHHINIEQLKNIKNLNLSFESHRVTALLGPNGNGKSTILHALAASFQPHRRGEDYKFTNFFLTHPHALWQGSHFTIIHSYRIGESTHTNIETIYSKTTDRWAPKYSRRPKRDVVYIGIDKIVPLIEVEKSKVKINYTTTNLSGVNINTILEKASYILNRRYRTYYQHSTATGKVFFGVEDNGTSYSALSMSAGEQKVFFMLDKIFNAEKYSLILIDELDLLLHDMALKKLIDVMADRANSKNLQIIFTTHRDSVLEMKNKINIRHLLTTPTKTLSFEDTKPDAINRLTGEKIRPLEIFVEDDLAKTIVSKIASRLGIMKFVSIRQFGASINCFTVIGGMLLSDQNCDNSLFVLDGDEYSLDEHKIEKINRVLTGSDARAEGLRTQAFSKVKQFSLPDGYNPEKFLHELLITLITDDLNEEELEIISIANDIQGVEENHKFVDDIIEMWGISREVSLEKIVDLCTKSTRWETYISDIHGWLVEKRVTVLEFE